MKNKPLSEKRLEASPHFYYDDVAEAVKKLKNLKDKQGYYIFYWDESKWILKEIDKIFGEELSGGNEK